FVLVLLGFVGTDFIITITLSAADATAHVIENPFAPELFKHQIGFTLTLIALLGAVFLKGFKEAIGLAVVLVFIYLSLNFVVISRGLYELFTQAAHFPQWQRALLQHPQVQGNPWLIIGFSLILFPKLALGLSGFETGVAVMPLVRPDGAAQAEDAKEIDTTRTGRPVTPAVRSLIEGRIKNTRKLLTTAA